MFLNQSNNITQHVLYYIKRVFYSSSPVFYLFTDPPVFSIPGVVRDPKTGMYVMTYAAYANPLPYNNVSNPVSDLPCNVRREGG